MSSPSISENDAKLFDAAVDLQIGDETYQASILTDRDFGDLDQWIKSKYINMAYAAADQAVDEALTTDDKVRALSRRKELIEVALMSATNVGWGTDEGWNFVTTNEGMIRMGFQFCRKRHPNLKLKDFDREARKDIDKSILEIDKIYGRFYRKPEKDGKEDDKKEGEPTLENSKS